MLMDGGFGKIDVLGGFCQRMLLLIVMTGEIGSLLSLIS